MGVSAFISGLLGIAVIALGGCVSTYEESDDGGKGSGYSEKRIAEGVYWLRFNGVGNESIENVRRQWSKRAEELCGEGNYTASPQDKNNEESFGYTTNALFLGTYAPTTATVPHVEGKVECNDKMLARQVGPQRYNPASQFPGFTLSSVSASKIDGGQEIEQQLTVFVSRQLNEYGVDSQDPQSYRINISVEEFIAEGWQSNWFLGGVSGGSYEMTSRVSIVDAGNDRIINQKQITTEVSASGESEYRLKTTHAEDLVKYAVSVFGSPGE